MTLPLINVVDADGWPDQVQMTVTKDYSYADDVESFTQTGSCTLTWQRQRLPELLTSPKLLLSSSDFYGGIRPAKGKFIVVQSGIGKMPGWLISFGDQDLPTDCFTQVYTDVLQQLPAVTSHFGIMEASLEMNCSSVAPGRAVRLFGEAGGQQGFVGLNDDTYRPNDYQNPPIQVGPVGFDVSLLRAGQAATPTSAAVGPLYRVTMPADAESDIAATVMVNGAVYPIHNVVSWVSAWGDEFLSGQVLPRSPLVADVQMANVGDVLAAGQVTYFTHARQPSTATVGVNILGDYTDGGVIIPIPDPFAHATLSCEPGAYGDSVTVSW